MSATNLPQLYMLRPSLDGLPEVALADGYHIRPYRPGDSAHWVRIVAGAFATDPEKLSFDAIMRADPAFRPGRVFFVCHGQEPVGTASAYTRPAFMPGAGMLHYVAVLRDHVGRGLGRAAVLTALHKMTGERRNRAWLSTDDFRAAAVRTYVGLGFQPLVTHESHPGRWRTLLAQLGMDEQLARWQPLLDGAPWAPPTSPPDMCRYGERLRPRRRWHPSRPAGTLKQDDLVSRDDESLYRGTELGMAGSDIAAVVAGEDRPFTLWFRAGPEPLSTGAEVRFHTPGQSPLGTGCQTRDPGAPGHVELSAAPARVRIEPLAIGFRIAEGALRPGDEIRLAIGRLGGFRWTPLAGRADLSVVVDVGPAEPKRRLPEPVTIHVRPRPAARLDVLLPMSAPSGADVEAVVSARDEFDNRAPVNAAAEVETPAGRFTVHLSGGLGRADIGPMGVRPLTSAASLREPPLRGASNPCIPGDALQLYVGDLHAHESTCEAHGYLADAYRWAIEDKRLDFLSLVAQCHNYVDNDKWQLIKHMAETFLDEGRFVTFPAFEWQHSHYGDKVVHFLGGDAPYLPVDDPRYAHPGGLYEAVRGTDAFIISHHPGYATDLWVPGTDFAAMETDVDRCVELWSMHGSSEGYAPDDRPVRDPRREGGVMEALRQGLRAGLVAGSDTHAGRPGGSAREPRPYWGGLCAVWAERLTRRSLYEAIRARRTYALSQTRIALRFTVNGAWMGSELPLTAKALVRVDVWAPSPIARVEVLRNAAAWQTVAPAGAEAHLEWEDRVDRPAFYHGRVTLADGHLAVGTPVWVGADRPIPG